MYFMRVITETHSLYLCNPHSYSYMLTHFLRQLPEVQSCGPKHHR